MKDDSRDDQDSDRDSEGGQGSMRHTRLPSGTLTFLATDIDGSTSLLRTLGDADYHALLEDHYRLLRCAFGARGGVTVDTVNDGCLAVFAGATNALAASLDAQLRLLHQPWPPGAQVRVRMGLHTGEARAFGGRYVALPVHQAARVAATAHGGQVLVSDIACQLVASTLPASVELADLGRYSLKDFGVQRVFQLCHPGLPTGFPPLRAPRLREHPTPRWARTVGGPVCLVRKECL